MSDERKWLSSRHLADNSEGEAALETVASLPPADREKLLATGDLLALRSVTLAHSFLVAAAAVARDSPARLHDWLADTITLLGQDLEQRDAASAWFEASRFLYREGSPLEPAQWLACCAALLERSRRLGSDFAEATTPALESGTVNPTALLAWRDATLELLADGGWREEMAGRALVETMPGLLDVLAPGSVGHWSRCVSAPQPGRRKAPPWPPRLANELAGLEASEQERCLKLCADLSAGDVLAARELVSALPAALKSLAPDCRRALFEAVEEALKPATVADGLADALHLLSATLHDLDQDDALFLLSRAPAVARLLPAALPTYLRSMHRALDEGGREGVELWLEQAGELADRGQAALLAHLAIHTRTAHKLLVEHSASMQFEEIEGLMQRYLRMMSRRHFQLVASTGTWLRPPLSPGDETSLRLPERVSLFSSSEDNLLMYKLTVAHVAGRWEYGSFDFKLDHFKNLGWSPPAVAGRESKPAEESTGLAALLESYPNPLLAHGLFVLLDGARIDACLQREFPGLAIDMRRLGAHYADNPPPQAADRPADLLLEALFHLTVGGFKREDLEPRLARSAATLAEPLRQLRHPEASVYDSATLFAALYPLLALADSRAEDPDDPDNFIELGGATILDPGDMGEDPAGPMPGAAGDDKATAGPDDGEFLDPDERELQLSEADGDDEAPGTALSTDEIRRLLEQADSLKLSESHGSEQPGLGLYITDLLGKLPSDSLRELRAMMDRGDTAAVRGWLREQVHTDSYLYDEWDYQVSDYRRQWCSLQETSIEGDGGHYYLEVIGRSGELLSQVRQEFNRMKPEQYRKVRGMEDGHDFDLNALVDAQAELKSRRSPTDRFYISRRREERDVATLFLVDMSASTDEPLADSDGEPRLVIDLIKETLVVLSEVLGDIGDSWAIYGFSGNGRHNVEYYQVKSFVETMGPMVKGRIGAIQPRRSTRMGTALRHSADKLARVSARSRHLILLSDGFPQDSDYGEDRRSNTYGIRDTAMALQELERSGVGSFCITIDPSGHDYLRDMCPGARYSVIDDISSLPGELPRVYRRVTRA